MGTPHTSPGITYAKWEWRTAEHLFSRHQVIAPFNTQAALRSALDLGATPTVYFARHDPHPSLEQMPCLPFYIPSGKGTTFPPGVLVLYPGQILRLQGVRANPKTGIVNGAKVKLLHIEINPAERSVLVPGCPRELTSTPLFLKVRLLKPGQVRLQVPGLETDEFLICPRKRRFTYLQPGPTPKAYKPQISMTRTQFPVMTGSALTEFIAQGTALLHVILTLILCFLKVRRSIMPWWICGSRPLDFRSKTAVLPTMLHACYSRPCTHPRIALSGRNVPSLAAYVMLSRVRSYSGLALLGQPAKEILFQRPDSDYTTFMRRIDTLASTTWTSLSNLAVRVPRQYEELFDLPDSTSSVCCFVHTLQSRALLPSLMTAMMWQLIPHRFQTVALPFHHCSLQEAAPAEPDVIPMEED